MTLKKYSLLLTNTVLVFIVLGLCACQVQNSSSSARPAAIQLWPSAFFAAVYANEVDLVKSMLRKNRSLIFSRGDANVTPLMVAASRGNNELVWLFISSGDNVNTEDDMGRTCLHYAILSDQVDTVRLLIKKQVDIDYRSIDDLTPLIFAAALGREKIVRLLVAHGADVFAKGKWDSLDARWWALKKEHTEIVNYLAAFYK